MSLEQNQCVVCAWRKTCQKKFSISGKDMRCADFVRDVETSVEAGDGAADETEISSDTP